MTPKLQSISINRLLVVALDSKTDVISTKFSFQACTTTDDTE